MARIGQFTLGIDAEGLNELRKLVERMEGAATRCETAVSVKDVVAKADHAIDGVAAEADRLREQVQKLQAFKDFVHNTLDKMGVPTEFPGGPHTIAGCRIGDRLEWVEKRLPVPPPDCLECGWPQNQCACGYVAQLRGGGQ